MILNDIKIIEIGEKLLLNLKDPSNNAPWFIFQLFFIQIVYFICCALCSKATKKSTLPVFLLLSLPVVICVLYIKKCFIGPGYTWISPNYLLLFILGHLVQTFELKQRWYKIMALICFIIFVLVVPLFDFHSDLFLTRMIIKNITKISFSLFAYSLMRLEYQTINEHIKNGVNYLGRHTLEIYLTHFYLIIVFADQWIDTGLMNNIPLFIALFIVAVIISYLTVMVSEILKLIPAMSFLLYGKRQDNLRVR